MYPRARRNDVIVQDAGADTLVYDRLRDAAHSLGPIAGYVFRHADGSRSVDDLTASLRVELGTDGDRAVVSAALWELDRVHLLEATPDAVTAADVSRRAAVRRFGATALALAGITSIAVPSPAVAKSGGNASPGKGRRNPSNGGPPPGKRSPRPGPPAGRP